MISRTISKTPLASDPDQAREQLEDLAGTLAAEDAAVGKQLRAVAVELVRRGLHVALVGYRDGWTELEATLPQAPHLGPVTVDRDAAGTTCQLAWDCWADITIPDGIGQVADAAAALLRGMAARPSLTPPSALTANPRPRPTRHPRTRPATGEAMTPADADLARHQLHQALDKRPDRQHAAPSRIFAHAMQMGGRRQWPARRGSVVYRVGVR